MTINNEGQYQVALAKLDALWRTTAGPVAVLTTDDYELEKLAAEIAEYEKRQYPAGSDIIYPVTGRIGKMTATVGPSGERYAQFGPDPNFVELLLAGKFRLATLEEVANPEKAAKEAKRKQRKR